jgi:hypothetical protein
MHVCTRVMHACTHARAPITAQEFEREKQGLLRQRQAQVLHHHHQLQQVFNLPGPQAGVDKGVADALLAGPPSFESGGVGGQGGGGWMTGGSKLMNGGRASKQAQPVRPNLVRPNLVADSPHVCLACKSALWWGGASRKGWRLTRAES